MPPSKMQMLIESIAEPPILDAYNLPVSKYKQIRIKSTKDLVVKHKQRTSQESPIYTNTTRNASPMQTVASPVK